MPFEHPALPPLPRWDADEEVSLVDAESVLGTSGGAVVALHCFPIWEWDEGVNFGEGDESEFQLFPGSGPVPFGGGGGHISPLPGSVAGSQDSVEVELARLLANSGAMLPGFGAAGEESEPEVHSILAAELVQGGQLFDRELFGESAATNSCRSPPAGAEGGFRAHCGSPVCWSTPRTRMQQSRTGGASSAMGAPSAIVASLAVAAAAAAGAAPPAPVAVGPPRTPSRNSNFSEPYASTVLTSTASLYGSAWPAGAEVEAEDHVEFSSVANSSVGYVAAAAAAAAAGGHAAAPPPAAPGSLGPPGGSQGDGGGAAPSAAPSAVPAAAAAAAVAETESQGEASLAMDESGHTNSFYALNESEEGRSTQPDLDDSLRLDFGQLLSLSRSPIPFQLSSEEASGLPRVRFEAPERLSCSICLDNFRHGMLLTGLSCGHVFHVDCLSQWVQRSAHCPNCRARVEPCAASPSPPLGRRFSRNH